MQLKIWFSEEIDEMGGENSGIIHDYMPLKNPDNNKKIVPLTIIREYSSSTFPTKIQDVRLD